MSSRQALIRVVGRPVDAAYFGGYPGPFRWRRTWSRCGDTVIGWRRGQGKPDGGVSTATLAEVLIASRVRVGVDTRVPRQFIGARELFGTSGERAIMGFFSRMGTNVASLMLEPMKRLVAHGALVGPLSRVLLLCLQHHGERWAKIEGGES